MSPRRRLRVRRWHAWVAGAALLVSTAAPAARPLPGSFGGINIGQPWAEVEGRFAYQELSDTTSVADQLGRACGYRLVSVRADDGELLVTSNDFVVTELAYTTPLEPGTDLMGVADLIMQTYGQPASASMRTAMGRATIDRAKVNHIELRFQGEHPVDFYVSGTALWQYQINVRHGRSRWYQNKTYRCAREREKALKAERGAAG